MVGHQGRRAYSRAASLLSVLHFILCAVDGTVLNGSWRLNKSRVRVHETKRRPFLMSRLIRVYSICTDQPLQSCTFDFFWQLFNLPHFPWSTA